MDYEAAKVWIDLVQFLWIVGATMWAFWGDKDKQTKTTLAAHGELIGDNDIRLTAVETTIKHLPSHGTIAEVHSRVNDAVTKIERVGGDVRVVQAEVKGVRDSLVILERPLGLIVEHLLDEAKKRS